MFRIIDRHPFISGFIAGFVGVGVVGRNLKKFLKGKITIIQIDIPAAEAEVTEERIALLKHCPNDLTFGEEPSGEEKPKATEES